MPSKEEIEQAKRNCKIVLETDPLKGTIDFQYNDVDTLVEGLEQQEAEKTKIITKLENDIKDNNFKETECLEDKGRYYYAKEILKILKGEKK